MTDDFDSVKDRKQSMEISVDEYSNDQNPNCIVSQKNLSRSTLNENTLNPLVDETINLSSKLISGDYQPKHIAMSLDESNFRKVNETLNDFP